MSRNYYLSQTHADPIVNQLNQNQSKQLRKYLPLFDIHELVCTCTTKYCIELFDLPCSQIMNNKRNESDKTIRKK